MPFKGLSMKKVTRFIKICYFVSIYKRSCSTFPPIYIASRVFPLLAVNAVKKATIMPPSANVPIIRLKIFPVVNKDFKIR